MSAGIDLRHARSCRSRTGGRCNCLPTFQAHVWDDRNERRIRKTFKSLGAAKAWRQDSVVALRHGGMQASTTLRVTEAAEQWLAAAREGAIRNRSGDQYKPSAIRGYQHVLATYVVPALGAQRFADLSTPEVQGMVDALYRQGKAPATVQTAVTALRAVYRRAVSRGEVSHNPTRGLELPAVRARRPRIVPPEVARRMIAALPVSDQPLWATAFFAGLRRGELQGLLWGDVCLDEGRIHVERGWDQLEGEIAPKSRQGRRRVPIPAVLVPFLKRQRLGQPPDVERVFGRPGTAFSPKVITARADAAWEAAGLERMTLHDCRHAYASFMIAAGVNAKTLSTYMGHAGIGITLDLYAHLMPGSEAEAAGLLDAYLSSSAG